MKRYGWYILITNPPKDEREKLNRIKSWAGRLIDDIDLDRFRPDFDTLEIIVHENGGTVDPLNQRNEEKAEDDSLSVAIKFMADDMSTK